MSSLDLRTIARATGGIVQGRQVLCPGPGHSRKDNSLSIRLSSQSPTGFIVYSHSGDDFRVARDYVAAKLGLGPDAWKREQSRQFGDSVPSRQNSDTASVRQFGELNQVAKMATCSDNAARIARARGIWDAAEPAPGSLVETYLLSRGLQLDLVSNIHEVIRSHPRTPWRDEAAERTVFVPCMVAALRQIQGDEITGIHRTRLGPDGTKLGRRMLGLASGAAVKLDANDAVTMGLAIGEGVETCLAAQHVGIRPVWALGSAGSIATFPVLGGIEALTILAENDATNRKAVETSAARWHAAGREVTIIEPVSGSDLNDAMQGAA